MHSCSAVGWVNIQLIIAGFGCFHLGQLSSVPYGLLSSRRPTKACSHGSSRVPREGEDICKAS